MSKDFTILWDSFNFYYSKFYNYQEKLTQIKRDFKKIKSRSKKGALFSQNLNREELTSFKENSKDSLQDVCIYLRKQDETLVEMKKFMENKGDISESIFIHPETLDSFLEVNKNLYSESQLLLKKIEALDYESL